RAGKAYVPVVKAIDRYWVALLSGAECAVLRFIVARTLQWRKLEEFIPLTHFLHGVRSRGGELVAGAVPHTKRTILRALERLEQTGLIRVQRLRSKERGNETNTYSVNLELVLSQGFLVTKRTKGGDIGNQGLCQWE